MGHLYRAAGFVSFSVCAQLLFALARVDIFEDFNIFRETGPEWWWFAGAFVLWVLMDLALARIQRPLLKHGVAAGVFVTLLAAGCGLPWLLMRDGLAAGIVSFLNGYWTLSVAAYWTALSVARAVRDRGASNGCPSATEPSWIDARFLMGDAVAVLLPWLWFAVLFAWRAWAGPSGARGEWIIGDVVVYRWGICQVGPLIVVASLALVAARFAALRRNGVLLPSSVVSGIAAFYATGALGPA